MSFYTTLTYYRSGAPPAMTGSDLANLVRRIREAKLVRSRGFQTLHVKFGNAIDQDEEETSREEQVAAGLYIDRSIEWDLDLSDPDDLQEIVTSLASEKRRIYRAHVCLGTPCEEILQPITRTNSPENRVDYWPDTLSIQIGPVRLCDLESDTPALVGWIGVGISGSGYLYPWTFRDVVERLEATPETQRLMEICRSLWPIPAEPPGPETVAARKSLGAMWPYDIDRPRDWYWGPSET